MDNTKRLPQSTLEQRMDEFQKQNPAVVEAMRLFGMSLAKYQGALHAMHAPRITQSDSTLAAPRNLRTNG